MICSLSHVSCQLLPHTSPYKPISQSEESNQWAGRLRGKFGEGGGMKFCECHEASQDGIPQPRTRSAIERESQSNPIQSSRSFWMGSHCQRAALFTSSSLSRQPAQQNDWRWVWVRSHFVTNNENESDLNNMDTLRVAYVSVWMTLNRIITMAKWNESTAHSYHFFDTCCSSLNEYFKIWDDEMMKVRVSCWESEVKWKCCNASWEVGRWILLFSIFSSLRYNDTPLIKIIIIIVIVAIMIQNNNNEHFDVLLSPLRNAYYALIALRAAAADLSWAELTS